MFVRRLSIVAGSAAAMVALSTGSAFAHFCYFDNGNEQANSKRAGTPAMMTFHDYVVAGAPVQICDAGIEVLADAVGVTTDTVMNVRGMMAGPTDGNDAIGHLDFGKLEGAIPDALAACAG